MGDLTTVRGKVHGLLGADAGDGDKICRICHRGLNAVGAGKPMELACACKQTRHCQCVENWFKFRGTAYARSVATRYRMWAKGCRLADMPAQMSVLSGCEPHIRTTLGHPLHIRTPLVEH
jgi:hypothetical protein